MSAEVAQKTEEELLGQDAETGTNGVAVDEDALLEGENTAAVVEEKVIDKEEIHDTDFPDYADKLKGNFAKMRFEEKYHDGALVITSGDVRKRLPVFMSLIGAGSPKLLTCFKEAKITMKESNYYSQRIDIEIPEFGHEGSSSPETALRCLIDYIYTGRLRVSTMSIKNVCTLAAYFKMQPVLDRIEEIATKLKLSDFDFEGCTKKGEELGEFKVLGLEKYVNAGFGDGRYLRGKAAAKKRKLEREAKERENEEAKRAKEVSDLEASQTKTEVSEEMEETEES